MTDDSPPPDFTPVPVTARHNGWTPARQQAFIAQLTRIGLVAPAARAVGMTARSAYRLRRRADAASFATAWDKAVDRGQEVVETGAIDRALNGTTVPVFYRGRTVGVKKLYHDRLTIAVLRERARRHSHCPAPPNGST